MYRKCNSNITTHSFNTTLSVLPKHLVDANDIGSKIKSYRLLNNLTQEQLAHKCNLHVATIKRYESHNKEVTPSDLIIYNKISESLNININILFNDYFKFISNNPAIFIKKLRESMALTQKDFGKLITVNRKTILRWENGQNKISYENYLLLLKLI